GARLAACALVSSASATSEASTLGEASWIDDTSASISDARAALGSTGHPTRRRPRGGQPQPLAGPASAHPVLPRLRPGGRTRLGSRALRHAPSPPVTAGAPGRPGVLGAASPCASG